MDEKISLEKYLESKIHYMELLAEANDRRYTEVNIEKEKALKIKEEADKVALGLARDIQKYKDEKANELREQINSERGLYATNEKMDAAFKPINAYISAQQGRSGGLSQGWAVLLGAVGLIGTILGILSVVRGV